jgi:hypothetical protein
MSQIEADIFTDSILGKIFDWLPLGWVWKRSPLGPLQTLLTVTHMTAFGKKGYRSALHEVFNRMHESFGWAGDVPTPSALTQARGKLSEKMIRDLFRRLYLETDNISSHGQIKYKNFSRIIAVDGTKVSLASTPALKKSFGCPNGKHLAPQALISLLWDIGGNVPIDWRIGGYHDSENGHLLNMLGSLGTHDMLLGDRLYPSRELMNNLQSKGIHFIFRLKTGAKSLRELNGFIDSSEQELVVELHNYPGVFIRLVRGHRPGSEHIVFATSLMAGDGHKAEAIADLYQRRWGVETAYREGKEWHGLSNLPGRTKVQVRQEVCSLMIFWLMQGELEGQARKVYAEEIRQQPSVGRSWTPAEGIAEIPVRFNRKLAAVSVAAAMAAAVSGVEFAVKSWRRSIRYLWQNRSRRRPGRNYRRTSERPHIHRKRDEQSRKMSYGARK